MTAVVHAAEIEATFRCEECAEDQALYEQRGRCVGQMPSPLPLPVWVRDSEGHAVLSTRYFDDLLFETCPRGLLRSDLNGDALAAVGVALRAEKGEIRRRWPDVPGRLWQLAHAAESARAQRDLAIQRASAEMRKRNRGR